MSFVLPVLFLSLLILFFSTPQKSGNDKYTLAVILLINLVISSIIKKKSFSSHHRALISIGVLVLLLGAAYIYLEKSPYPSSSELAKYNAYQKSQVHYFLEPQDLGFKDIDRTPGEFTSNQGFFSITQEYRHYFVSNTPPLYTLYLKGNNLSTTQWLWKIRAHDLYQHQKRPCAF